MGDDKGHSGQFNDTANQWSIHVMSMELETPGPNAHHNYLSFRGPDGKEQFAIHGLSIDRKTGDLATLSNPNSTLRVVAFEAKSNQEFIEHHDIVGDSVLYAGGHKDFSRYEALAVDAGHFINRQNLNYTPIDIGTPQNSNSVAYTLVKAMGLEFPEDAERLWAPGHGRILLPRDWHSEYENPAYNTSSLRFIVRQGLDYALYPPDVVRDVKNIRDRRKRCILTLASLLSPTDRFMKTMSRRLTMGQKFPASKALRRFLFLIDNTMIGHTFKHLLAFAVK
ncbi:MAG: hypothetical protein H6860_04555 [Rhodospirillales bacterium]|nr:hypothetical protein [Rhodospirillales bacterium]